MARPHLNQAKNPDKVESVVVKSGGGQDSIPSVTNEHGPTNRDRTGVQVHPRTGNSRSSFAYVEIPIGGITMFIGKKEDLPENWRVCDGEVVDDPESPLFGEPAPDLRGLFVRGVAEPDMVKEVQGSDVQSHSHTVDVSGISVASRRIHNYYSEPYVLPSSARETGFQLRKGGSYSVSRTFRTLEVARGSGNSHKHTVSIDASGASSASDISSVPRHMLLHYIVRIR